MADSDRLARTAYRRLWAVLSRRGWKANVKRVYHLYREEGLMVRRLKRKRLSRIAVLNPLLTRPNQEWALAFVSDALANGRGLRALTVVDSFTRECPVITVYTGISGQQVTRALERVIEERGSPQGLRCDNGPEFASRHFIAWWEERRIGVVYIQPGRPMQNGHVESFNGRFRDEYLNANWFLNLGDAQRKVEACRQEYNAARPHSSLDYRTPKEFARVCAELSRERSHRALGQKSRDFQTTAGCEIRGRSDLTWCDWGSLPWPNF